MMGYSSVWTKDKLAKAKQLRADGMPYRKIAKAVGVSHGAVRYQLNPHHRLLCIESAKRQWAKRASSSCHDHNPSIEAGHGGRAVAMSSPAVSETLTHTHIPCTD